LTFLDFYLVSQLQIYRRRSFSSTFPDFKKALEKVAFSIDATGLA